MLVLGACRPATSTLEGHIRFGPLAQPELVGVMRTPRFPGDPPRPWVQLLRESDERLVSDLIPASDGSFHVDVPPGRYIIRMGSPRTSSGGGGDSWTTIELLPGVTMPFDVTLGLESK